MVNQRYRWIKSYSGNTVLCSNVGLSLFILVNGIYVGKKHNARSFCLCFFIL